MKISRIRHELAKARSHIDRPGYGHPTTNARIERHPSPAHVQRFRTQVEHWERMLDRALAVRKRRGIV